MANINSVFHQKSVQLINQYENEKNQNNWRLGRADIFSIGINFNISYQNIVPLDRHLYI